MSSIRLTPVFIYVIAVECLEHERSIATQACEVASRAIVP